MKKKTKKIEEDKEEVKKNKKMRQEDIETAKARLNGKIINAYKEINDNM